MVTILPLRASAALLGTLTSALHHLKKNGLLPQDVLISSAYLSKAPTPEEVVNLAQRQATQV